MPVPYMGSKRKSVGKIYRAIANREPRGTLVDLFCGGFAVGERFLVEGWKVIANDKNKYIIALLKQTINKELDESIVTRFVTRERFVEVLANRDNYEDWYVGFIMCIWSFGNNQSGYLFGKEAEPIKHAGHRLVIDQDPSEIMRLIPNLTRSYINGILKQDNWHKRRLALARVSKALKARILELEQLQHLEQLERLERLQHLERLERLERLQHLERLELTFLDYDKVIIPEKAVVYCDPPYRGTAEYAERGFDHNIFWDWCRTISKTNKLYVSEYSAPDDFVPILTFPQRSTLQGGNQKHNNQPDEKLFVPKWQIFKNCV